jgi:hypothetical protein
MHCTIKMPQISGTAYFIYCLIWFMLYGYHSILFLMTATVNFKYQHVKIIFQLQIIPHLQLPCDKMEFCKFWQMAKIL